jgi:hypothetical protein
MSKTFVICFQFLARSGCLPRPTVLETGDIGHVDPYFTVHASLAGLASQSGTKGGEVLAKPPGSECDPEPHGEVGDDRLRGQIGIAKVCGQEQIVQPQIPFLEKESGHSTVSSSSLATARFKLPGRPRKRSKAFGRRSRGSSRQVKTLRPRSGSNPENSYKVFHTSSIAPLNKILYFFDTHIEDFLCPISAL